MIRINGPLLWPSVKCWDSSEKKKQEGNQVHSCIIKQIHMAIHVLPPDSESVIAKFNRRFLLEVVQVRGLPCAHNFHVECIDEWLRLNVKCPRCRCSVFPNLDLSAISNLRPESERSSVSVLTANRYVRTQPYSHSYLLRLQGLLRPVRTENAGVGPSGNEADTALETAEYGGVALSTRDPSSPRPVSSAGHIVVVDSTAQQQ